MSETSTSKIDMSKIRLPVKKDTVTCFVCGQLHQRRPGSAHTVDPLCQACDDKIHRHPTELSDTVDFKVKGF